MLNRVIIMGRITQDLEVKQTPSGVAALTFNVAVDRNFKNQNGEYDTDFITCVAWRQTAENIGRYFSKGRMICIEGNLRTRTYDDKNGSRHYVTEVFVDAFQFTGEPKQQNGNYSNNYGSGGYNNNNGGYNNGGYNNNNGGYNNGGNNGGYNNNNGGYNNNNGGYNNNGNNSYQQPPQNNNNNNDPLSIGNLADFEEVYSDGDVPF